MTRDQVLSVIDKLDNLGYIRKGKITGQWHTLCCPFHNNGQEKKPSCGVLLEDQYRNGQMYPAGMVNCLACHYSGNIEKWVQELLKIKNVTGTSVQWLETNIPGFKVDKSEIENLIPSNIVSDIMNKYAAENLRMRVAASKQTYVSQEELASYRFTVPYMYQRRLTDDIIDKFDVGFDAKYIPPGRSKPMPCVTFPVHDVYGNALFIARRSIEGKFWGYPEGVMKPVYGLYQLPKDCKSVVIVESIFNCLTCWVYGYPAVALLGTSNAYQMDQLLKLGVREFVLCMDGDEAGRRAASKLKKALTSCAIVWTVHMPEGTDVNETDKATFDALYAQKD